MLLPPSGATKAIDSAVESSRFDCVVPLLDAVREACLREGENPLDWLERRKAVTAAAASFMIPLQMNLD